MQPSNHVADAVHVKSVSYYSYQTAEQRKNVITVIWVPDGPLEYFSLESLRKLLQKKKIHPASRNALLMRKVRGK